MAKRKEYQPILIELRLQGWLVEETKSGPGHYKAYPPMGPPFFFGGSGDPRAIKNTISALKRLGFKWKEDR